MILYGRKDVEGKNRLETKDEHGIFYIEELPATGSNDGGGYVKCCFTKKGTP